MVAGQYDATTSGKLVNSISVSWIVASILFVMSFTLDSRRLWNAARSPAPVIWACSINVVLLPLASIAAAKLQFSSDLGLGLIIACSVPCTMASASVWTRKAAGNDAISLIVTLLTNGFCFLITPFWLAVSLGGDVQLDAIELIQRLIVTALLPTIAGQLFRLFSPLRQFADRRKNQLGTLALTGILTIVFRSAVLNADYLIPGSPNLSISGLIVCVVSCNVLHLAAMGLGWYGCKLFKFNWPDTVAVLFASSQKTLPIGVYIATLPDIGSEGTAAMAVFPIIAFHVSQLFVDTLIATSLSKKSVASIET